MTAIVGIRCKYGVVIGADSSATFGDGGGNRFIEQSTRKKIEIIGDNLIVAGTGAVGHMQRFSQSHKNCGGGKSFSGKSDIEIGKMLSSAGIADFNQTHAMNNLEFAAMVAYPANDQPSLCELPGGRALFQPEIKKVDDLWFASTGSGQSITDPFLALLRKVYWRDEAPALSPSIRAGPAGGLFCGSFTASDALLCLKDDCDPASHSVQLVVAPNFRACWRIPGILLGSPRCRTTNWRAR